MLPHGLRALRHRDFRVFFAGQSVALVGGWVQAVAQSWLVLQLTGSPLKLGLLNTFHFAPMLLFSLVAGAVVDRLPKRRLLVVTASAQAGQALALAALVATGVVQYWHVAVLALTWGVLTTLDTPARLAFVTEMVGKADAANAIALNSAAFNGARVVGPALAGVLIASMGMAPAFVLNGLAIAVVVGALLTVRTRGLPRPRGPRSMAEEIAEGLRYALGTPLVLLMLALLFVVSLCVFNFAVFIPLLVRDALGAGPEAFGFLMAALGVGAVIGALALGALRDRPPAVGPLIGATALACAALVELSAVRHFWSAALTLVVVGVASIVSVAGVNTTLQLLAPDALRGRVMSLYTLVFGGVFPVGALLMGLLAERWGIRVTLAGAGGAGLTAVAAIAAWWRWRRR
jgi:predicted MFS family arabinose efflux permease